MRRKGNGPAPAFTRCGWFAEVSETPGCWLRTPSLSDLTEGGDHPRARLSSRPGRLSGWRHFESEQFRGHHPGTYVLGCGARGSSGAAEQAIAILDQCENEKWCRVSAAPRR